MAAKLVGLGLLCAAAPVLAGEPPAAAVSLGSPAAAWVFSDAGLAPQRVDGPPADGCPLPEPPPPIPQGHDAQPPVVHLAAPVATTPALAAGPAVSAGPTLSAGQALGAGLPTPPPVENAALGAGLPTPPPADNAQVLPPVWAPAGHQNQAVDAQQVSPAGSFDVPVQATARQDFGAAELPVNHPVRPSGTLVSWGSEEQQQPGRRMPRDGSGTDEETPGYTIQLEPPGTERLFRLESEARFQERLRQEAQTRPRPDRIEFPVEAPVSTETYTARHYAPMSEVVEPNYTCYQRLYFEEKNSERYGWDLGFMQPFVSAGVFWWDLVTLPYNLGTEPCRKYECSAGYCLPGDPVPYLIYPPEFTVTGSVLEAGTIVALFAIFPG
jgi:hypothetical protein